MDINKIDSLPESAPSGQQRKVFSTVAIISHNFSEWTGNTRFHPCREGSSYQSSPGPRWVGLWQNLSCACLWGQLYSPCRGFSLVAWQALGFSLRLLGRRLNLVVYPCGLRGCRTNLYADVGVLKQHFKPLFMDLKPEIHFPKLGWIFPLTAAHKRRWSSLRGWIVSSATGLMPSYSLLRLDFAAFLHLVGFSEQHANTSFVVAEALVS